MHTLDDLRAIRALESVVGDRQTQEENYRRHQRDQDYLKSQQQGTPVAVLTYNLATRQIAVRELPHSADSEAHE